MILPKSYLDETCGVRPGANQESFNNIIYTIWYMIARVRQGNLDKSDMDALIKHINLNTDEHGLYTPKNSHDNITYKIIASKVFHLNRSPKMNFWQAIKQIGIYRAWDVITYGAIFGPKILKPFFYLLLWIPSLQMIQACASGKKIRPDWINDGKHSRILWWWRRKKLIRIDEAPTVIYKTWELYGGGEMQSRHMQNDGTHLSVFRLYALKDEFKIFKLTAKICRSIMIRRYGKDYTYEIINKYFRDRNHPVIPMWKGHGDILE